MTLDSRKELEENDVYFFETLEDKLLINNNYEGVVIFDSKLNLLKKIKIFHDLTIEFSIKNNNKILLICPENGKIIYINLIDYQYKIISLVGFDNWIFSPLYNWNEDVVVLSDYKNNFMELNLKNEKITVIDKYSSEYNYMQRLYEKLNEFHISKIFVLLKKAIVENTSEDLKLISYTDDISSIIEIPKGQFHDFEATDKYIAEISESKILIINYKTKEYQEFFSQKEYYFLRGKFIIMQQKLFLYLLSGKRSNECKTLIEKYSLYR